MNQRQKSKPSQATDRLTRRRFLQASTTALAGATLLPSLALADSQSADAALPAGMSLNWDQTKIETVNAKRSRALLDGLWRFMPAVAGDAAPPKLGWGFINVPGSWARRQVEDRSANLVVSTKLRSPLLVRGSGPQWEHYDDDGSRVASAWYERQVPIPAEWQGRMVSLRFDRVCTDAIVYVNGVDCGQVPWPWGSVDITRAVTPGQTANVQVLVAAIPDAGLVGIFMQNAFLDVNYSAAKLKTRGLTGNVYLESRSSEAHVTDAFVRTSTRKKELALDVDLAGVAQAGRVHFVADMLNEKGEVEKSFMTDAAVEVRDTQTVTVSWPWANPRLWDVDRPNLYTLRLTVKGAGLDDQYNQEFGFREFWTEGRQFYLNGTVIRLRQPCFYKGPLGEVGDNFAELGNWNPDTRGDDTDAGKELGQADRKGYLAAVYVLDANKYMMDPNKNLVWEQNRQRALERADVWIHYYRNHPSAVMWISGANFFNNSVDLDPRHLGRHGWAQGDQLWRQLMDDAKQMFAEIRKLDLTRVYYSHEGSDTGDVYSANCYLDLLPLQEREEWLSAWAESGEMPITMTEFGTPVDGTFRRGHEGYSGVHGDNVTSEPLLTEYATIYFGTGAYTSEGPEYRQFLHDLFRGGMLYGRSEGEFDRFADMLKIQDLYRTNTCKSWRTAGLPGGLRTWSWLQNELKEFNFPTLAWIAGPAGAYTAKNHHFSSGQKFQKQIVLINDTRQPQVFTANWIATAGGKTVGKGELRGTLAVSEIRKIPVEIAAPRVESGGKADGQIALNATIGGVAHDDAFAFRVFGAEPQRKGAMATIDPKGLAGKMMANLGFTPHAWNGATAPLVVVGRDALKDDPAVAVKLEPYVRGGGRVLIMAQDPGWITEALGWRVCPKVSRYVFPIPASPVAQGIDADDLRDWTGDSTLIEAYPKYEGDYLRGDEGSQPYAGWHWGNRGGVASGAIEKPHRSGWTPLLECEFDLAYTPLMELDYGQGRIIVCTLDLEDHVALDPAARLMAERVMDYALHAPLAPRVSKVVYVGGNAGAAWLDKIGVGYERSETLDTGAGLVLIGPEAKVDSGALDGYLAQGGKAFFLPRAKGWPGAVLTPAAADFAGSLSVPGWPEAKGLNASDLRWRSYLDRPPLILSGGVEIGADGLLGRKVVGKGVAIFCQVDPDSFEADEKTYFRYTRWRATRAVAQLLANLGASFAVDRRIFDPRKTVLNSDRMWVGPNGDRSGHQCDDPPMPSRLLDLPPTAAPEGAKAGYYHPDYRTDFPLGDNPYRYYRW
jgi:beta-galactosidase